MSREILERDLDMAGLAVFGPRAAINPNDVICLRDMPTFTSGLTQDPITKIVRGDYITGKAGGQTWTSGTAAGDPLLIQSSSNAQPGVMTLSQSQLLVNLIPASLTAGAGSVLDAFKVPGAAVTIGGGTTIATVTGFNWVTFLPPVLNGGLQIAHSATLAIAGQPTGTATLNDPMAFWVQTGTTRLGGTVIIQSLTGMLKATSGTVGTAAAGTDFESPLTFGQGVTRVSNAITGDYITGLALGGGETTWTGGTGAGESIYLRTTSHATKGRVRIGSRIFFNEATGRIGVGTSGPACALELNDSSQNVQLRIGDGAGECYDIGLNQADGLLYFTGQLGGFTGYVFAGLTGGTRLSISDPGVITIPGLGGGTATLVKTSTAGALSRAAAGTDYQLPLSAADGTIVFPTSTTVRVGTLAQKFLVQGTADTTLSGAQFMGALATGLVKNTTTTGVQSIATPGTDYEPALTFSTGLTRLANTITADIATGHTGGQTAFGGKGTGEALTLSSTAHATKGSINFGTSSYDENANFLKVISTTGFQIRSGQSGANNYDLGRSTVDGLFYVNGNHATIAGIVITGTTGDRFKVDSAGAMTVLGLAGTGSTLTKVSATGLFSRAASGTDFEVPLTFNQGVTRASNVVSGDYITGIAIGGSGQTVWTGGTGTGEGITLRTTSHATRGKLKIGTLVYDESTLRLGLGEPSPVLSLDINGPGNHQFRLGSGAGLGYDLGRSTVDSSLYFTANQGGVYGFVFDDTVHGVQFSISGTGVVTIPQLGGGSSVLVKTSTVGVLSRAIAGTDYAAGTITLTAGAGLTGGGDLSANRTFDVVANADASIVVNANDIQVGVINDTQHGSRGGGALHPLSTSSVAGFMSAANTATMANATFVVRSSTNVPTSAQNIGALTSGVLKHTVSGGLSTLATATGGTDYEFPLTFSTGLTRVTNTITADLSTGIAGSQSVFGGNSSTASANLTLVSTSNATKGLIKFGLSSYDDSTTNALNLVSANATTTIPGLILSSNSASGQAVMHFRTSTTSLKAGIRADSTGNLNTFTLGGNHSWLTAGDFGSGFVRAKLFANGNFQVAGSLSAGTDPTDSGSMFSVTGTSPQASIAYWGARAPTITPSASYFLPGHLWDVTVVTFSGSTHVTTTGGVNWLNIFGQVYTNAGSMVMDQAATVAINSGPIATGLMSISNRYALWCQGDSTKIDGQLLVNRTYVDSASSIPGGHSGKFPYLLTGPSTVGDRVRIEVSGDPVPSGVAGDLFYFWVYGRSVAASGIVNLSTSTWATSYFTGTTYNVATGTDITLKSMTTVFIDGAPLQIGEGITTASYSALRVRGLSAFEWQFGNTEALMQFTTAAGNVGTFGGTVSARVPVNVNGVSGFFHLMTV